MSSETFTGGIPLAESEKKAIQIISSDNQEEENKLPIQSENVPVETTTEESVTFTGGEDVKITNLEKLDYGFDKTTQILGNVYRIGKAKVQDIFDDEKSFKDYILENEEARQKDINKEHWKFATGKYDDDNIVKAAEIATLILDPGYILAYATPWGRAALKSYKMASLMGGITISADVLLRDLATTGEIDYGKVGFAGAAGAVLGPIAPAITKVFQKYAPNATKQQVDEVVQTINNKIAKNNNLSSSQLNKIQAVAQDKTVVKASNELSQWTNANFVAPVAKEVAKVKNLEKILKEKNQLLLKLHKSRKGTKPIKGQAPGVLKTKTFRQQLLDNKSKIIQANKNLESVKAEIYKSQVPKIQKYAELIANRNGKILEKLKEQDNAVDFAVKYVLSATTKPLIGGAAGLTGGVLFGDEDTNLLGFFIAGAALGKTQSYIQASKKFAIGDKNKILNAIDSDMVKLTLQQVRALTSATSSTKLATYGGPTEQIGKMLLQTIDDPVSQKSVVANAEKLTKEYFRKAYNLVQGYSPDEQAAAVSIVRGKKINNDTPEKVVTLSKEIQNYLKDFKKLYNDSGFFSKTEIDDYFPRVLNWDKINKDPKQFEQVLEKIFKDLKYKDPKKAVQTYLNGHTSGNESVFNREVLSELFSNISPVRKKFGKEFIYTPVSEHITHDRLLRGPYKLVEEVLEKNNYLVNDVAGILSNMTNKSMRSIAFARQFGENGQLLKPFFEQIKQKYANSGLDARTANKYAAKEAGLVADTVDAYFDRYGKSAPIGKSIAAILSTMANLNMLGRVTISSLGDLVQPFQNSSQFSSWFKALPVVGQKGIKTSITAKGDDAISQELNYALTNEISTQLTKPLATAKENVVLNSGWMGKTPTSTINKLAFKALGLEWLTGFARRFAYNVGAGDIFGLSKSLAKVNSSQGLNSKKALKIINDLEKYGVNTNQALSLSKFKTIDQAIKDKTAKKVLNQAGIVTSNRDALIPQVDNRLLFTQSRNEYVRLLGQFMSWAMAKSAQTNKILQRIENGNVKTLVKTLAVLPVYSSIQSLREVAKYGEVVTDYGPNKTRWWSEGFRLSGQQGFLADLFVNRIYGPGSREPWYFFAPSFQISKALFSDIPSSVFKGEFDKAYRTFWQKIAPIPNWRNRIKKILNQGKVQGVTPITGDLSPIQRNVGGSITTELALINDELKKNEEQDIDLIKEKNEKQLPKSEIKQTLKETKEKKMNIKDTVKAGVVATTMAATGVNADVSKAQDNFLLPKEKPKVEVVQKEKPKDYSKLSELPEDKKKFLLDSASVIYQNNQGKDVPSDILIAIALEETGYGTSRFYKEGNNYFNMVAEKGDDRIKAKGDNTQVAKFESPSESLDKFYTWVENKPHYKNVRETLEKYKEGEATKGDIIDAISDTGWAENPNWSKNVKSILKSRVNGKHSEELKNLESSLFKK
tara:strand:+ start:1726 stop:6045 length:4320 start_codon:yes stop_codon:yes gene_type:complete